MLRIALCLIVTSTAVPFGNAQVPTAVRDALNRAVESYRKLAVNGGYVYYYTADGRRLGEGVATATQVWVQPPGTPAVGDTFLKAWKASGNPEHLKAADAAAEALMYGQLQSGGWTNSVDFDPKGKPALYRNGKGRGRNYSTFDDDITTAALRFLVRLDQAHEFRSTALHEAVMYAFDQMLAAQHTSGGFPQVWDKPNPGPPRSKASFPNYDWKTEGRVKEYWLLDTLNDDSSTAISETLILAHQVYGADRYRDALIRLGDFLIAAQFPEPQPGWAQQYTPDMHPAWARRFEPPAIAGRETQDAVAALLLIHQYTGENRFLNPIPDALNWLERSRLPDGRLARYYEIRSNRPLYMQRSGDVYSLTYDDSRLPDHYGWKTDDNTSTLRQAYNRQMRGRMPDSETDSPDSNSPAPSSVSEVIRSLQPDGFWYSTADGQRLVGQPKFRSGERFIASETFCRNAEILADALSAGRR